MKKRRADDLLFEKMNLESLKLARSLIMEGRVMAGDRKIMSSSETLPDNTIFRVIGMLDPYVSRGAHKLKKALEVFNIDLTDRVCIDIGSSTGGFTDVMLRNNARHVYCVDVGYNLLDYRIRSNERVTAMERTNARFLQADQFTALPEFGATDVSFISLKAVLPTVLPILQGNNREFVALIKPQFEAEKSEVGEKGVVRDPAVHEKVLNDILQFIPTTGWETIGLDYSPIRGPEGNIEFLLYIKPQEQHFDHAPLNPINDIICSAYDNFSKSTK